MGRRKLQYFCDKGRHLVCKPYTIDNLHRMAEELGIKRCWYHRGRYPHYDIPQKDVDRINELCTIIHTHQLYRIIYKGLYNKKEKPIVKKVRKKKISKKKV